MGRQKNDFQSIALRQIRQKDWREIVNVAIEQAIAGDAQAREFVARLVLSPPLQDDETQRIHDEMLAAFDS